MTNTKRAELLQSLYDQLPKIECKGLCYKSCGPIMMSKAEEKLITNIYHTFPHADETLTCNFLNKETHDCAIYFHRPMICRLYGLIHDPFMSCEHDCKPNVWLTREQSNTLLGWADQIEGSATPRQRNAVKRAMLANEKTEGGNQR